MKKKKFLVFLLVFAGLLTTLGAVNVFTQSIDNAKTIKGAYAWSGHANKDKAWAWAKEVEDRLSGVTANQSFFFDPTDTAPTVGEGRVYFNDTANMLVVYGGGAWHTLGTSTGGDSLDTAYNSGHGITVDGTGVTLTTGAAVDNSALVIVHGETTNDNDAMSITNASDESTSVSIQIDGTDGYDIQGTGDTWNIGVDGAATLVGVTTSGELIITTSDVLFNDTYDVSWDTSRDMLMFEDNAILCIGGDHDGTGDLTIKGDGTDVLVEDANQDGADLIFGSTNALDILIHNDAADSLITIDNSAELVALNGWDLRIMDDDDIVFGDDVSTDAFTIGFDESSDNLIIHAITANDKVQIGNGTTDTDLMMMTNTGTTYCNWDASADEMVFDYADLKINDQSQIEFADSGDATDWAIDCVTGETLLFTPTETSDDQSINFGHADNTTDFRLFGENASTVVFDSTSDAVVFDKYDIRIGTGDYIGFGDTNDFLITASSASQLDITTSVTTDIVAIDIGVSGSGVDVNFISGIAGDFVRADASRGDWLFEDVNIVLMDDTDLAFGDSNDFTIQSSGASQLDIASVLTNEVVAIDIGADTAGIDVNFFGSATGDFMRWDASGTDLILEDANIMIMDDTTLIFGDGSDVTIQYDENGDNVLQVTGAPISGFKFKVNNIIAAVTLTDVNSGQYFVTQALEAGGAATDVVITLPTAAAGLHFWVIDGNTVTAADTTITAAASDKILFTGGAAGSWAHDTDAETGAYCHLIAIDSEFWLIDANEGTWVEE